MPHAAGSLPTAICMPPSSSQLSARCVQLAASARKLAKQQMCMPQGRRTQAQAAREAQVPAVTPSVTPETASWDPEGLLSSIPAGGGHFARRERQHSGCVRVLSAKGRTTALSLLSSWLHIADSWATGEAVKPQRTLPQGLAMPSKPNCATTSLAYPSSMPTEASQQLNRTCMTAQHWNTACTQTIYQSTWITQACKCSASSLLY